MYSFTSRIRYSECDEGKHLTIQALLDYFQDCSTFQSEEMGTGLDYVDEKRAGWILASWQIRVERLPRFSEEVIVGTWPHRFDKLYGYRNFVMKDASGAVLAAADSYWIYYDMEKARPVRIPEEMLEIYGKIIEPRLPMEEAQRKIALPEQMRKEPSFPVQASDIDTNHHVNNGRYVRYALQYLPKGFSVKELRVEYARAAVLGDVIYPMVSLFGGRAVVNLAMENGRPFAVVEFLDHTASGEK